ncbi:FAD-dependent oxidoreductase [Microbacterium sp. NPDC077644]|uniref:NAD(P)/FAD-dependent oxidoreductase n=1 Tax=Microbacterium sp. NPDC077644 TaxID=3155055 RepID=UPI00344B0650
MTRTVIVGGSVGGVKAAQALRSGDFDGEIVIVEQENLAYPYDKPPLSKAHLVSDTGTDGVPLVSEDELSALGVTWRSGTAASGLEIASKEIVLADGERLSYDDLIIATGARARPSPWGDGPRIHLLRTSADAARLRAVLHATRRLVVVGGGFIGAEVAATARSIGAEVTIVDPHPAPMSRALNEEIGQIFADKHAAEGVKMLFATGVEGIEDDGTRALVSLSNGERIEADAVLVGIGAVVNTEWLEDSGLVIDNGVVTDDHLRAVGADDIHVIGDVCRWQHSDGTGSTRLEHWTSAADQARLVAHNVLSPENARSYDPVEYVWSDQYDWRIQIVGRTGVTDSQLLGDPADDRFAVAYSEDGVHLTGAVVVNWPRALISARRAVQNHENAAEFRASLERMLAVPVASAL